MEDEKTNVTPIRAVTSAPDKVLSMEDIEAAEDVVYARVPGFKTGQVFAIGSLTAGDIIEWTETNQADVAKRRTAGLRLICKSLVDGIPGEDANATGRRIALDEKKNIPIFRAKSHRVTERVVEEILKLNEMIDLDKLSVARVR